MSLVVIPGRYRVVGASPDGDSVRFSPDDPTVWARARIKAKPNAHGAVQLRLDAIDALETHYTPPHAAHGWRQPAQYGDGAAARLLELLGFTDVERDGRGTVTAATPQERAGYILTRFADVHGRAVCLAFAGHRHGHTAADGTAFVSVAEMMRSANYQLLADGWVYPTFYSRLYVDFRTALAEAAVAARTVGSGLWSRDSTLTGFEVTSTGQLTEELVILPKLFRRLAEYLTDSPGDVALSGFRDFLAAHDDRLLVLGTGQMTGLDTVVTVKGHTVALAVPPEELVFLEA